MDKNGISIPESQTVKCTIVNIQYYLLDCFQIPECCCPREPTSIWKILACLFEVMCTECVYFGRGISSNSSSLWIRSIVYSFVFYLHRKCLWGRLQKYMHVLLAQIPLSGHKAAEIVWDPGGVMSVGYFVRIASLFALRVFTLVHGGRDPHLGPWWTWSSWRLGRDGKRWIRWPINKMFKHMNIALLNFLFVVFVILCPGQISGCSLCRVLFSLSQEKNLKWCQVTSLQPHFHTMLLQIQGSKSDWGTYKWYVPECCALFFTLDPYQPAISIWFTQMKFLKRLDKVFVHKFSVNHTSHRRQYV